MSETRVQYKTGDSSDTQEPCCLMFQQAVDHEVVRHSEDDGWHLLELIDVSYNETSDEVGFLQQIWAIDYCPWCGAAVRKEESGGRSPMLAVLASKEKGESHSSPT